MLVTDAQHSDSRLLKVILHIWLIQNIVCVPCILQYIFVAYFIDNSLYLLGFPCGSAGKESSCRIKPGFDPWVGKIPWRRERQTLQYSGLEHSYTVHGVAKSRTQLSDFHFPCTSQLPTPLLPLPASFTPLETTALLSVSMSLFSTERFLSFKILKDQTSVTHS